MLKGTSRAEVTSNSEKIKCVALAIVELRWSEGIRQAGRQAVEFEIFTCNKVNHYITSPIACLFGTLAFICTQVFIL